MITTTFRLVLALLLISSLSFGQENINKAMLKDTLDGKFDFSNFLLNPSGFFPVPQIISEPALGGFGLLIAPVFIHPNKHQVPGKYTPPNITAALGGLTVNKSWFVGGVRVASLPRHKLRYRVGGGYASVHLDFYREIGQQGERQFTFHFKSVPIFGSIMKEVGNSDFYVGIEYLFLKSNVSPEFEYDDLPEFVTNLSLDNIQSSPGIVVQWDRRDNVFTPNKGFVINSDYRVNADWTGSDFNYQNFNISAFKFFQTTPDWVSGFRVETQQQFDNAPFYARPGINMRGVPAARYQGTSTYLLETEQRIDFSLRWSGVVFGGLAKAIPVNRTFSDATTVYNYGVGMRYLIARMFGIRAGVDIAASNDDWGYYIVFGSAWNMR